MHVLITVNAAWNLVNFRRALIEALLADGHRVTVLAPEDAQRQVLEGLGCRFIPLAMDIKGLSPRRDLALMIRFWLHFRREAPDVILSYTIKNNIFGALAARSLRIPFFPNVSGLGTAFLTGTFLQKLVETLYRSAFRKVPIVFFQNGDDKALFLDRGLVSGDQPRLLPGSGIDLVWFGPAALPERGSAAIFLLIARLLRDKGVVEFVEAARFVKARYPDARFQLLGPLGADNRSAIDPEIVKAWVSEGSVEHLGATEDVRPSIREADCVVLPSYREGTPRTLLEAAAMARPLIATDVPGCRNVVEHGHTGLLCDARSVSSLQDAMMVFLTSSQGERREMGLAGRRKMERDYDQALVISAYRDAIADIARAS